MPLLRRLPLAHALQVAIPVVILLFTLGSGATPGLVRVGHLSRWVALFCLLLLALLALLQRGIRRPPDRLVFLFAAAFVLLALLSAFWSVDPRLTVGRALSLAMLFATMGALSLAFQGDLHALDALLVAVVAGAVLICLGGLLVLAIEPSAALQSASPFDPVRWKGLGENPNTVCMVAAVAAPDALRFALQRDQPRRWLYAAALVVLFGTIVASGSRGAIGALGVSAPFTVMLLPGTTRARVRNALAALVAVAVGVAVMGAALPSGSHGSVATTVPNTTQGGSSHAGSGSAVPAASDESTSNPIQTLPPIRDELGSGDATNQPRGLFGTSGRSVAWRGAIDTGLKRPLLGYGFGTEERVFVDRYYYFESGRPENSYIGIFLQLGLAGDLVLVGILLAVLWRLVRIWKFRPAARWTCAAAGGAVVAGAFLATGQSYLYSVGNIAMLPFWLSAFVVSALAGQAGSARPAPARRVS